MDDAILGGEALLHETARRLFVRLVHTVECVSHIVERETVTMTLNQHVIVKKT